MRSPDEIAAALGATVRFRLDPKPGTSPLGLLALAYWFDERQKALRAERDG